jgi:hypothetical protein
MSGKGKTLPNTYEVGYRKPPVHTRFRKGQSGNPTGERRGTEIERAKALLRKEVYRLINVREGDKTMRVPTLLAVLRSQLALAAKGNVTAQRAVLRNIQEIEAEICAGKNGACGHLMDVKKVDLDGLTDEELMQICLAGQNDKPKA